MDQARLWKVLCPVIATFDMDLGPKFCDQGLRRILIEKDGAVYRPESFQDRDTVLGRIHWAPWALLKSTDGIVAIDTNNEQVAKLFRFSEVLDVPCVENVEDAVGKDQPKPTSQGQRLLKCHSKIPQEF